MPYTAKQQLDLIKANKLDIIDKINELLGTDSGLAWDSPWSQFLVKINEIKTTLPIENDQIIAEIEHFITNQSINSIAIASDTIKENIFRQKTSLLTINAPNVEQIEQYAFNSATGLLSIVAPNCVNIGSYAFQGCTKLESITFDTGCILSNYAFDGCSKLRTISNVDTSDIPDYCFNNCANLECNSESFPNVKTIGNYAFYNCDKLLSFDFSKTTSIGTSAFYGCDSLTNINLLGSTASISNSAFRYCSNVMQIIIPETIGAISQYAFSNLSSGCEIYCEAQSRPSNWNANWYSNAKVYWNAKLRDYTFVLNNGDNDVVKTLRAVKETDLPIIEKQGYTFDSWYINSNFTVPLKLPYVSSNALSIYARWIRQYSVILVMYDTFEQINAGTFEYANLSELPLIYSVTEGSYSHYTNVGAYLDAQCTQLITNLDIEHVPTPIIYIKATPTSSYDITEVYDYTGNFEKIKLLPGHHLIECWGAQGGYRTTSYIDRAGKGGYATGQLDLATASDAYIYVGGSGNTGGISGGFNGGGARASYVGGGGASDVRIGANSLFARVVVAGGGGSVGASQYFGGYGGGLVGQDATNGCGSTGYGGTQISSPSTTASVIGSFGQGGYGAYYANGYGGAGGGGWYGGDGCYPDYSADDDKGGGGGSGWVYTEDTYNNWATNSVEGQSGNWLLSPDYYLINTSLKAGNEIFLSPEGVSETGHSGDGYIRIHSWLEASSQEIRGMVNLIGIDADSAEINLGSISAMRNLMLGDLPDSFLGWSIDNWYTDSNRTIQVSYPYEIQLNGSINLYTNAEEIEEHGFEYTGEAQEILLNPGKYKLECWGAQGGDNLLRGGLGGRGGYACGTLETTENINLVIMVGGAGQNAVRQSNFKTQGGFNGGGPGMSESTLWDSVSGGGASDIRIKSESLFARVIVAGGGGAAGGGSTTNGGYGGGANGGATADCGGAGQTFGGTSETQYSSRHSQCGSFGKGDGVNDTTANAVVTGAGGGWYGGGAGVLNGASGGSGYVYTANTAQYYPTGCLLNSNYYLTDTTNAGGNIEFKSPDDMLETGHTGNGYVRITKIRSN